MGVPAKDTSSFSSGLHISSRQIPTARSSEIKNPIRRSFSGNPFAKPSVVPNPRGFNLNTPANSPSVFPRRSSTGRESIPSSDFGGKENGRDENPTPALVRSPAASKSTKNFMSPTISAASKMNASPRKKVLAERNELVRSSVSFSDVKSQIMEENELRQDMCLNQKMEASHDMTVTDLDHPLALKSDAVISKDLSNKGDLLDSLPGTVIEENVSDGSFKISLSPSGSSCSIMAPIDADPLWGTYDPKTNYLSPRPQFLHYRPNPRIELYLNKEREGKQLDESFASESSSETEVTEAESQSEDLERLSEDVSSVGQMEKGEEEQEQEEKEEEKEEEEEEEEKEEEKKPVSEPNPMSTGHISKDSVELKGVKSGFSVRSKFVALLLLVATACFSISVTDSPVIEPFMLRDVSFFKPHVPPEFTDTTKAYVDKLAKKFRLWSTNSFSYIYNLVTNLGEVQELGPLQYGNLTGSLEYCSIDGFHNKFDPTSVEPAKEREIKTEQLDDHQQIEVIKIVEEAVGKEYNHQGFGEQQSLREIEPQVNTAAVSEEHGCLEIEEVQQEIEIENVEEAVGKEYNDQGFLEQTSREVEAQTNIEAVSEEHCFSEIEEVSESDNPLREQNLERVDSAAPIDTAQESDIDLQESDAYTYNEQPSIMDLKEQPRLLSQAAKLEPEASKYGEAGEENEMNISSEDKPLETPKFAVSPENLQLLEMVESAGEESENKLFMKNVLGISLLVLSLFAAIAFMSTRKGKSSSTPNAIAPVEQPVLMKKLDYGPMSMSAEHLIQGRLSSMNWQMEVDMVAESCSSEMSSFQKSSSSSKKGLKESGEALSQERKPRRSYKRESLASSLDYSTGTPSYGSFTTYEKIPPKNGLGDEEVVTPVRRSSRLRSQVISS